MEMTKSEAQQIYDISVDLAAKVVMDDLLPRIQRNVSIMGAVTNNGGGQIAFVTHVATLLMAIAFDTARQAEGAEQQRVGMEMVSKQLASVLAELNRSNLGTQAHAG